MTLISPVLDYLCSYSYKFFDAVLPILKTTNFNLSEKVYHNIHFASKLARKHD